MMFPATIHAEELDSDGSTILTGCGVGKGEVSVSGDAITSLKWNFAAFWSSSCCELGGGDWVVVMGGVGEGDIVVVMAPDDDVTVVLPGRIVVVDVVTEPLLPVLDEVLIVGRGCGCGCCVSAVRVRMEAWT
jgi:hypothetical protein